MNEWQPIETAPRDKTTVLLFIPDARREKDKVQTGSCGKDMNKKDLWIIGNQFGFEVGRPTHWMSLPEPPK